MAEIHRLMIDIGEISANMYGFDYKWDSSITRTHIKKRAFYHEMMDLYKSIPHTHMDKLQMRWPDLVEPVTEFKKEVHEFFKPHHYKVHAQNMTEEHKSQTHH